MSASPGTHTEHSKHQTPHGVPHRMGFSKRVCLFVLMIFNKGTYLIFKSISHKALKNGIMIIAICYLSKSQCSPLNVEC